MFKYLIGSGVFTKDKSGESIPIITNSYHILEMPNSKNKKGSTHLITTVYTGKGNLIDVLLNGELLGLA